MKKHIILAAALTVICLHNLVAQGQVNATVIRSFERKFVEASNVRWQPQEKGVSLVQFRFQNENWLAYYSSEGNLIASGRKVKSPDQLPVKVKETLESVQEKYESKYGTFLFGTIVELITDGGTKYYIPLENSQISMLFSIDDSGESTLQRKDKHASPIATSGSAIAKKD